MTETRPYPQRARERIAGTKIIDRLVAHVNGEIDMTPTQVRAAAILLNKVLPDVKSVEVDVHEQLNAVSYHRLTDEQLMAIAAPGLPEAIEGEVVPTPRKLKRSTEKPRSTNA